MTVIMPSQPTAEQQLAFLAKMQRLFSEGDFTATYKFALVIALSDLAVEQGRDSDVTLRFSYTDLAQKFIDLYWNHTVPYARATAGTSSMVLIQNLGQQAAVVTAICQFRETTKISSRSLVQRHHAYPKLLRKVADTVSTQPATYLQNLGGSFDPFLFTRIQGGLELKPGVGHCLRQFQPLIQQLARQRWIQHIKSNRRNAPAIGSDDELETFLFAASRQSLDVVRKGLSKVASGRCFYCGSAVGDKAEVDHFVPFSIYPRDLMHNFVYAHGDCNRRKSDTLAAKEHLERWLEFGEKECGSLMEIGVLAGIPADRNASRSVSGWAYQAAFRAEAQAWIRKREYEKVGADYLIMF